MALEEKIFKVFPIIIKSMGAIDQANLETAGGMVHPGSEKILKVFPIISLWELYAMATRVPIQSAQTSYAAFPPAC